MWQCKVNEESMVLLGVDLQVALLLVGGVELLARHMHVCFVGCGVAREFAAREFCGDD